MRYAQSLSFVLAASIALAWPLGGGRTPPVLRLLDRVVDQGVVVPQTRPIDALKVVVHDGDVALP